MPALLLTCFMTSGGDSRGSLTQGVGEGGTGQREKLNLWKLWSWGGLWGSPHSVSYPGKGPYLCFTVLGFELPQGWGPVTSG